VRFFTGLHHPADAKHFDSAFISVHTICNRKSDLVIGDWIMDSGAFTTIAKHGGYPKPVDEYAAQVIRWSRCGNMLAAVAQDYMCEPHMLKLTGLTIADHQRLTIERYDALLAAVGGAAYIMPVLQGYAPSDYVRHLEMYGDRLGPGAWVGVGSVCKRNGDPGAIEAVLLAIHAARPDLRLHGFGLKTTALSSGLVQHLLYTADSMAWSYAARKQGRDANDWREAKAWASRILARPVQEQLFV
jgi:hypothetical protein